MSRLTLSDQSVRQRLGLYDHRQRIGKRFQQRQCNHHQQPVSITKQSVNMGLHNDQACSDRLAYGLSSR